MGYTKVTCTLRPDSEMNREILIAELGTIGYESFTESYEFIDAYISTDDYAENQLLDLAQADFLSFRFHFTLEIIPDQNWNEIWEKNYYEPLLVAEKCLVRAPFHTDYPKAEYEIVIDPGMAFGTGNHETTELMIAEVLIEDLNGKFVLDMGCGTGILGILASMRGAKRIIGIDIDSWAFKSTAENAANNNILNLQVILGGAEVIPETEFDFIYANIHRNILINDMPQYCKVLNKGGQLIMSGFYTNDLDAIKTRACGLGLNFYRSEENEKWSIAIFTLK